MNRWPNRLPIPALIVGAALAFAAMPAHALICYEIIDRTDTVVFRDSTPPVDLSEAGARSRAAMRDRGELLMIYDTDACIVAGRISGGGNRNLTVEEIVAEWRGNWGTSSYNKWSPSYDRVSPPAQSVAPASTQSAAPAPSAPVRAQRSSAY